MWKRNPIPPPRRGGRRGGVTAPGFLVVLSLLLTGCQQEMANQPRYAPLAPSDFFADGMSARPRVPGSIPWGPLPEALPEASADFPEPLTRTMLTRGRERYEINCSPCHDRVGNGNGMIVQRGFPRPPSLHEARLVEAAPGHFVRVITEGYGMMAPYANRVTPEDRWAIAAYIRALQLSQAAPLDAAPPDARARLEGERP